MSSTFYVFQCFFWVQWTVCLSLHRSDTVLFPKWVLVQLFTCLWKFHHPGLLWVSVLVWCAGKNVVFWAFLFWWESLWRTQWILSFAPETVTFRFTAYCHKMSQAGEFKAKPSSLKSHTGQHAVCVCVCEDSLVTTSYSLCVASSASFTLLPLLQLPFCTYMSSCFRKTIQQSTFALTQTGFVHSWLFSAVE